MKFRAIFLALITLALLNCGCKPASENEPVEDNSSVESKPDQVADKTEKKGQPLDGEKKSAVDQPKSDRVAEVVESKPPEIDSEGNVRITGDLGSIDWQSMIGRQVTITGDLVVVDTYDLARRGQVKVARNRLYVPTSRVDPNDADPNANSFEGGSNVAKVVAAQKQNDFGTIILDDTSEKQNIFPPTLFPKLGKTQPTVRVGSVIKGFSGKLRKAGNKLVLGSNKPPQWKPAARPQRPDVGKADIVVSSFNVLNYFTTLDDGSNDARGADSDSELKRQEAKIVSAIIALKADVIGLMEIENNLEAENRLVDALNKKIGEAVFKGCGLPDDFRSAPGGSDSIRVGIIYRADRVEPVGDVSMIHDEAFFRARTPIIQSFKSKTVDNPFAVVVNHFKSKGGAGNADSANKNKGDGRVLTTPRAARSLWPFVNTSPNNRKTVKIRESLSSVT